MLSGVCVCVCVYVCECASERENLCMCNERFSPLLISSLIRTFSLTHTHTLTLSITFYHRILILAGGVWVKIFATSVRIY